MICPLCGAAIPTGQVSCRTCGAPVAGSVTLPAGATLNLGQYLIGRVLGRGGFGITYEARDQRLQRRVAIKELFVEGSTRRGDAVSAPSGLSAREFTAARQAFLEEGKTLAGFDDPGIVRILNCFEGNNTAYLVMEHLEGRTLGEEITEKGALNSRAVEKIAVATAQTLATVHRTGLLHRDIKPDNILLEHTGRIVLIDFGSVRAFVQGQTVSHTRLVTPGYAPLEQYGTAGKFGPYTDIYALGATLHHALTGRMPPAATDLVLGTPLPPLPGSTLLPLRRAVEQAMAVPVKDRPQSAKALLELLRPPAPPAAVKAPARVPAPSPAPAPPRPAPPLPPPAPLPADLLNTYLRQHDLTETLLRGWLYDGSVNPRHLPAEIRQALIHLSWLDARGKVPRALRRTRARRPPSRRRPRRPRNIPLWPGTGPSPAPVRHRRPFHRALLWVASLTGIVWCALVLGDHQPVEAATGEYLAGGFLGWLCGYIVGELIWLLLPLLLPLAGGSAAYFYASQAALPPGYLVGLPALALGLSFVLIKGIRRI